MSAYIPQGLVIDIDDTLSPTARVVFEKVKHIFPDSTSHSVEELECLYGQPGNVPEWETMVIQNDIHHLLDDPGFFTSLPSVSGAQKTLHRLVKHLPVGLYLTSRLEPLREVTQTWLRENLFPEAPLVMREETTRSREWKLQFLSTEYTDSFGIIDDSIREWDTSSVAYGGHLLWFNPLKKPHPLHMNYYSFESWEAIEQWIEKHGPLHSCKLSSTFLPKSNMPPG